MSPPCPCGSSLDFADCCGPRLSGAQPATTAEQLMRSRYTAYATGDSAYLQATWHASSRPRALQLDSDPPAQWIGLKIIATEHGQPGDTHGRVEFVARYKVNGRAARLYENSRFVKEDGRWYYVDGKPNQ